jgi:hypothetical protein
VIGGPDDENIRIYAGKTAEEGDDQRQDLRRDDPRRRGDNFGVQASTVSVLRRLRRRQQGERADAIFLNKFSSLSASMRYPRSYLHSYPRDPPANVAVDHACLLIPVAVAFWWFWTKSTAARAYRKTRRVLSRAQFQLAVGRRGDSTRNPARRLGCAALAGEGDDPPACREDDSGGTNDPDEDSYESWDQVVRAASAPGATGRGTGLESYDNASSQRRVLWIRGPAEIHRASLCLKHRNKNSQSPCAGADGFRNVDDLAGDDDDDDAFSRSWDYIQDWADAELCSGAGVELSPSNDGAGAPGPMEAAASRLTGYRPFS